MVTYWPHSIVNDTIISSSISASIGLTARYRFASYGPQLNLCTRRRPCPRSTRGTYDLRRFFSACPSKRFSAM
jgi:hypothetical protein